jgi:hypothetical protein
VDVSDHEVASAEHLHMEAPPTHSGNKRHFFGLDSVNSFAILIYPGAELYSHVIEREREVSSITAHNDLLSHSWPNHEQ